MTRVTHCERCGVLITNARYNTLYCRPCAEEVQRERVRGHNRKARYERLKAEHKCVTCMAQMPITYKHIRCPKCHEDNKKRQEQKAATAAAQAPLIVIPLDDKIMCTKCKHLDYCRKYVRSQVPLYCQKEERKSLKRAELRRLENTPALMVVR